jgi:WD40 repeat protein
VTSSDDRTVRVWDLDTGRNLAVLWAHSMPVLSADGTILVAHAENGLVVYSLGLCGSTQELLNEVAKRAARDLTPEERERF